MINFLKNHLKGSAKTLKLYQKLIGYYPENEQWCRVVMNEETKKLISNLNHDLFSTLEISGTGWSSFSFKKYQTVNYPEFDICSEAKDEQFDLIIAEQVFEHLKYPYRAGKNIVEMLKTDGYFLLTTPFLLKIHPSPTDCTRWTPEGMLYFLEECGFSRENIQTFGWGNRKCVIANFKEWYPYNENRHSLTNEAQFPVVVWALAKKG